MQEGQKEGVVEEEVEGRNKSVTPKEYLREREADIEYNFT